MVPILLAIKVSRKAFNANMSSYLSSRALPIESLESKTISKLISIPLISCPICRYIRKIPFLGNPSVYQFSCSCGYYQRIVGEPIGINKVPQNIKKMSFSLHSCWRTIFTSSCLNALSPNPHFRYWDFVPSTPAVTLLLPWVCFPADVRSERVQYNLWWKLGISLSQR